MRFEVTLTVGGCRSLTLWAGVLFCFSGAQSLAAAEAPTNSLACFTNAASVHALTPEMAEQNLPVCLEGVITHFNRGSSGLFLQDETDGIYVRLDGRPVAAEVGDRVRVEGQSEAGAYAPVIRARRVQNLGRGELPQPKLVTATELATGQYDSRWVEVRGIVRSAAPTSPAAQAALSIQLRSQGKDLLLVVDEPTSASTNLVDAVVVVRGVAAGVFSWQRQLLEPVLAVTSEADIAAARPPPPLDSLPVKTIQSLFRYSPEGFPEHRVRLRGQLLGRQAGKWLAVRDATSGLFVESPGGEELVAGDEIELIGFPETREHTLWLIKTVVRKLGSGSPTAPLVSSVTNAFRHPCELHRIEGTLTGPPRPGEGSWVLNLRQGEQVFEAWLPAAGGLFPADWREGARLAVTGITEPFILPRDRKVMYPYPRGLRLHARTLADVELVRAAPWWTAPRITKIGRASCRERV